MGTHTFSGRKKFLSSYLLLCKLKDSKIECELMKEKACNPESAKEERKVFENLQKSLSVLCEKYF